MADDPLVHYHEADPAPALRRFVQTYWTFSASPDLPGPYLHRVPPDGCASLIYVRAPGAPPTLFYAGPRCEAREVSVPPGTVYRGIRLQPGAAGALFSLMPDQVCAPYWPASLHLPALADALMAGLAPCRADAEVVAALDAVLLPLAEAAAAPDAVVAAGVAEIVAARGNVQMDALAARLGLSTRQFQRRFRQAAGLTPKQFARVRRFRESIANVLQAHPDAWARVAAEHGFADQAHMTREFNALYGLPPVALEQTVRTIEHGPVRP